MIWVAGRVVPDEALSIPAADRAFEHGLGLFETLRTWDGRPRLLEAHLGRMTRSAGLLGLPIRREDLPDARAVARLLAAEGVVGDRLLRITASGGVPGGAGPTVWMRAAPLPPPTPPEGIRVSVGPWVVASEDPMTQHKSLNYWSRRIAHEQARGRGFDEVLSTTPDGRIWEGSRTNLFLVMGDRLKSPSVQGPIVPGIMRRLVAELALRHERIELVEGWGVERPELGAADEVFLTNSVRGIIPVRSCDNQSWPAPGPVTRRLQALLSDHVTSREDRS